MLMTAVQLLIAGVAIITGEYAHSKAQETPQTKHSFLYRAYHRMTQLGAAGLIIQIALQYQ